jgi:hypothetical protein
MVAEFEGEGFLSGTPQSDKGNGCTRGPYASGKFNLFLLAEATELRGLHSRDHQTWELGFKIAPQRGENFLRAAIEENWETFLRSPSADPERQIRTVDAVWKASAVQPIQNPPDGLAIRNQQVEMVKAEFLFTVEHPSH